MSQPPVTAASILLAGACLLLQAGIAQAQTPPPEPTPCCPSACMGLVEATPGGPTAPSNLAAHWGPLPDVPEESGVVLAWQDNAGDETCQVVQRKGPADGEWEGRMFLSPNDDSADDRNFEALGEYCYRVFAANERGASVSNEACVDVPEVTVHGLPPGAPPPSYPTLPPGVSPSPVAPPPTNPTWPAGSATPAAPAALPDTGAGSGPVAGPSLPWSWFPGLAFAAAFATAAVAAWQIAAAGRRR